MRALEIYLRWELESTSLIGFHSAVCGDVRIRTEYSAHAAQHWTKATASQCNANSFY
jgi:hypothetical protein